MGLGAALIQGAALIRLVGLGAALIKLVGLGAVLIKLMVLGAALIKLVDLGAVLIRGFTVLLIFQFVIWRSFVSGCRCCRLLLGSAANQRERPYGSFSWAVSVIAFLVIAFHDLTNRFHVSVRLFSYRSQNDVTLW